MISCRIILLTSHHDCDGAAFFYSEQRGLRPMKLEQELQTYTGQWGSGRSPYTSALPTAIHNPFISSSAAALESVWVKLHHPPKSICSDEALLLCQTSEQRWVAWIPDYGKISLHCGDFTVL
jgi:hypothetical protein